MSFRIFSYLCVFVFSVLYLFAEEVEVEESAQNILLRNAKVAVHFSAENDWRISYFGYNSGNSTVRYVKLFEFLRPTAEEVVSSFQEIAVDDANNFAAVKVKRTSPYFYLSEKVSLHSESASLNVEISLRMRKEIKIGIMRLPIIQGSVAMDSIIAPEDDSIFIADSAGRLANVRNSYDDWFGMMDSKTQHGCFLVVRNNRADSLGIFRPWKLQPGFLKYGFEMYKGPFGELKTVTEGDEFSFQYELALFQEEPEKQLTQLFPDRKIVRKSYQGIDANVRVLLDPTLYRDDEEISFIDDFTSTLAFLFYQRNHEQVDAKDMRLVLDLPETIPLKKAVIFNYWMPQKITTQFAPAQYVEDNKRYTRYSLSVPDKIKFRADKSLFDSLKHHQLWLYLDVPPVSEPTPFTIRWHLEHPSGNGAIHEVPGQVLPFQQPRKVPEKFELWYSHLYQLRWVSPDELAEYSKLLSGLGISAIDRVESAEYMKNQVPDINVKLRDNGFKLVHSPIVPLRNFAVANKKDPEPGSIWKTINGERICTGNNCQQMLCPTYLVKKDTLVHKGALEYLAEVAPDTDYFWYDWEGKTWAGCYCDECLQAFADHADLDFEHVKDMKPVDLVRQYPKEWTFFRNWQTGEMYNFFKKLMLASSTKKPKFGWDFAIIQLDQIYPGLGIGYDRFCDDPRLMKNAKIDFGMPDVLHGGIEAYDALGTIAEQLPNLPLYCKTGAIGGLGFYAGSWVSRRLMANFQRRPMGLDIWPRLTRLMIIGFAANGAAGAKLGDNPADGATLVELSHAVNQLAAVEDYYFTGKRDHETLKVLDVSVKEKQRDVENSLGCRWLYLGRAWEDLVRCTVHQKENSFLITLFNFDLVQPRVLTFIPTKSLRCDSVVYDPVSQTGFLSPDGNRCWQPDELKAGLLLKAESVDCSFLAIVPATEVKNLRDWQKLEPGIHLSNEHGRALTPPARTQGSWQGLAEAGISLFPWW